MKTVIVLAMHGAPPNDFPPHEMGEYFRLHAHMEAMHNMPHAEHHEPTEMETRYAELERKMRTWPRTEENDPFFSGSMAQAEALGEASGLPVVVGFNEFCAPDLSEAFNQAAEMGAERVVALTPMMTAGGEHSERDIPKAIEMAESAHPGIEFVYAWPFDGGDVAAFLAAHVAQFAT